MNEKCVVNNGLCSIFCLLILFGWMCVCEEGVLLEKDGRMCKGGEFLVFIFNIVKGKYVGFYEWFLFS